MDIKTNRCVSRKSVKIMKILKLAILCSASIKKCTEMINTKFRIVFTSEDWRERYDWGTQETLFVFTNFYFLSWMVDTRGGFIILYVFFVYLKYYTVKFIK